MYSWRPAQYFPNIFYMISYFGWLLQMTMQNLVFIVLKFWVSEANLDHKLHFLCITQGLLKVLELCFAWFRILVGLSKSHCKVWYGNLSFFEILDKWGENNHYDRFYCIKLLDKWGKYGQKCYLDLYQWSSNVLFISFMTSFLNNPAWMQI